MYLKSGTTEKYAGPCSDVKDVVEGIVSDYKLSRNLHQETDNLSFALLVIHNPASKGSKYDSSFNAKLPSPKHV
jgi:hypothetical protein